MAEIVAHLNNPHFFPVVREITKPLCPAPQLLWEAWGHPSHLLQLQAHRLREVKLSWPQRLTSPAPPSPAQRMDAGFFESLFFGVWRFFYFLFFFVGI